MDLRHIAVLMLTVGALLVSVHSQAVCLSGWFGSWCQYKCRCSDNYCTTEGTCGHGVPCQSGWFGPACQYADLAYGRYSARDATDGDDTTCLDPSKSTHVTIILNKRYYLTWLRVRLSKPDLLYNLTVHFRWDASLSCTNKRTARVDNITLDIHCDLKETVDHVVLSGEGVQHLCSVYISGGRNVALKQHSSQASTYFEYITPGQDRKRSYPSHYAVDGNSDSEFYEGNTCSHTLTGGASLNISFSQLQRVTRYVLYNRAGYQSRRLKGFELRSFGPSMTPLFNYEDRSQDPQQVYTIVPDQLTPPIHLVNVAVSNGERILTLCELEVYGDSVCQPGEYGRECEHTCNCAGDQSCFVSTGGCPSGCAAGFLGQDCGTWCGVGSYGPGCQLSCSKFCVRGNDPRAHFCDNTNGTCLHGCQSGYQGSTCSENCDPGSYGPRCQSSCSQFCVRDNDRRQHFCDKINGTCLHGCQSGYLGSTCAERCDVGRYGIGCQLPCSQLCVRDGDPGAHFCDNTNGTCLHGCQSGYQGFNCTEKLSTDIAVVVVPVIGGAGVLVLVVVAIVFWRRRKRTKCETYGDSPAKSMHNIYLSRIDPSKVCRTPSDDRYDIPGVSTAVTQSAALIGSQGKIETKDMFGDGCVVQSCDDSVAQVYEEVGDNLASPCETVVDDSYNDITPTLDCPEYENAP